ncbi:MAG: DUF4363 family protein [Clostridia bacterium]|nr:DUF4363 family protein [Clostridia bacterium]
MKGLWIAAVLACVVTICCILGIIYVNHATDVMEEQLLICIHHAEEGKMDKAKATLASTKGQWEQERLILMMYTDQSVLDEIDDHLAHMAALADHHPDEFVPTATLCLGKLKELKQRENLSVYSWF